MATSVAVRGSELDSVERVARAMLRTRRLDQSPRSEWAKVFVTTVGEAREIVLRRRAYERRRDVG